MDIQEYLHSNDWKTIKLEFGMSTFLLSLVSSITTLTKENNIFQWTDCSSIGASSFLIVFIGLHGNKEVFQRTLKNIENVNYILRFMLVLTLSCIFIFGYFVPLINNLFTKSFDDVMWDLGWNFVRYFAFSSLIAFELYLFGLFFYDKIAEFFSVQNNRRVRR